MNRQKDPSADLPYALPFLDPEDEQDLKDDPYVLSKAQTDLSFLDVPLLIPRLKQQLLTQARWKGAEDEVEKTAAFIASEIRGAYASSMGEDDEDDEDSYGEIEYRYPNEMRIVQRASSLRNGGKSDADILKMLKAEV